MVFGVFDGLHEGHLFFLNAAASKCDELIVVVAEDEASASLKGRLPKSPLHARIEAIESLQRGWTVVAGDKAQGEWSALKAHKPDMVYLGHDQHAVAAEFERMGIAFSFIEAHSPDKYKSSLML